MEKEKGEIASHADPWRYLIPGLNMQGRCSNESCQAYDQQVLVQFGMGYWKNVYDVPINCPMCGYGVDAPWEPWLYECEYRLTVKYDDLDKTKKHGDVKDGAFHNYEIKKDCVVTKCRVKCWPLDSEEPDQKLKHKMQSMGKDLKKDLMKEANHEVKDFQKILLFKSSCPQINA